MDFPRRRITLIVEERKIFFALQQRLDFTGMRVRNDRKAGCEERV
jgi:hypothetical protein